MTTTQPAVSYARPQLGVKPQKFHFNVAMFPDVTFTVQKATVPAVSFGVTHADNPLQTLNLPGNTLTYNPLPIRLMLDEELLAYTELYGWMRNLGFPTSKDDFATVSQRFATLPPGTDPGMPTCDLFLSVLNSANNPVVQFTFEDAFPIYIGELTFDTTEDGVPYMYVDVEFAYNWFTVNKAT